MVKNPRAFSGKKFVTRRRPNFKELNGAYEEYRTQFTKK
jgi:hypothetical protein